MHMFIDETAREIATNALRVTALALISGDFDSFAAEFALPHHIATPEGTRRVETISDLRDAFDKVVAYYRKIQVDYIQREVETAFFDTPETLRLSYTSQLHFADKTADAPYYCHATMRPLRSKWQLKDTHHALGARKEQSLTVIKPRQPALSDDAEARQILQDLLDDMTGAFLQSDLPRVVRHVKFPFFLQGDEGSHIYKDDADLMADLRRYQTEFLVNDVTDFVRTVRWAEMIGDSRLQGLYSTHILSGATVVANAYSSAITLELDTVGAWRCTSVLHPIGHLSGSPLRSFREGSA